MLFSHPELAAYMSEEFECAWESVRPVPRVTIDFGDGRTLERTLHGNVVTYFCTSEGRVFDLLPGIVDAREYAARLDHARELHAVQRRLTLLSSKSPGKSALGTSAAGAGLLQACTAWHAGVVDARKRGSLRAEREPSINPGYSKSRVERVIDERLGQPLASADRASLERDTATVRTVLAPLASQVWLEHPLAKPAELTHEVYRRVLDVDLDDPYLGLAPEVLGGELGRR